MTPEDILNTLNACLSGTRLTVAANTFGAGGIQNALIEYFGGGNLVLDSVTLAQTDQGVSFTAASGVSAPLNGTTVSGSFNAGTDGVDMVLTAALPSTWTFASAWPILANTWVDDIVTSDGILTLASVGSAPTPAGLSFTGKLSLASAWDDLLFLLGEAPLAVAAVPISQTDAVPGFSISISLAPATLNGIGDLYPSLVLSSAAVTNTAMQSSPPAVPVLALGLSAAISFAGRTVSLFIDLSVPGGPVPITVDVSDITSVTFDDFSSFLDGHDLAGVMPGAGEFDPGNVFVPASLGFVLLPNQQSIASVGIQLSTTTNWEVTRGISVGPVALEFQYQCVAKSLQVRLYGNVNYDGGSLVIGANYPDFTFTGCLSEGSTIDITDFLENLTSYQISGPQLILDDLDIAITPSTGYFNLLTGLTVDGSWSVPIGESSLSIADVYLLLQRDGSGTSGNVKATGMLDLDGDPATFSIALALGQAFSLTAEVDNFDLATLAATLSGTSIPSGVTVTFTTVSISVTESGGDYDFAFTAAAAINGTPVGNAVFELREGKTSEYGVLAGFVVTEAWSPARVWSALGGVLDGLTINDLGVLISTLPGSTTVDMPQLHQPSVPSSVVQGFTAFASLDLAQGSIVAPLSLLFGSNTVEFDFLLVVDGDDPAASQFTASLPGEQTTNAIRFDGIQVTITEGPPLSASLSVSTTLTIQGESMTLDGTGTITMAGPPRMSFLIDVENWVSPFGIHGLTVDDFGLSVTTDEAGLGIGLQGKFDIGTSPDNWTLQIAGGLEDFEEPEYFLFELSADNSEPLTLGAIISQFTGLDLQSVPILSDIGFMSLEFYVVADPGGATINGAQFPAGIGIAADILVFSWEAKFNIQVDATNGIIASGSINKPIELAGIFTLSDVTGSAGPSGSINTTSQAGGGSKPYFTLDGKVTFLAISDSVLAQATGSSFEFDLNSTFLDIVDYTLACNLIDDKNFTADATVTFDLDVTLGPLQIDGCTVVPQVSIDGPSATLDVGITVDSDASLSLSLDFSWSSFSFNLQFSLSVDEIDSDLSNLGDAVLSWMKQNVDTVFAQFLSDASAWVHAIGTVFADLANDIGNVAQSLAKVFGTGVQDAAAFLRQLGYDFSDIVGALVEFFSVTYEYASEIVENLYQDCAMSSAEAAADPGTSAVQTVREFQYQLTRTPLGQQLLIAHYRYGDEIWRLLAYHPRIRVRLKLAAESPRGTRDLQQLADLVILTFTTVAPEASRGLRALIHATLPELDRLRRLPHQQILAAFQK